MTAIRRRAPAVAAALDDVSTDSPAPVMARVSAITAGTVIAIGLAGVLGWFLVDQPLDRALPTGLTIRFDAAVALLALGAAWFVPRVMQVVLGAVALLIGGLTMYEYLFAADAGLDQLVVNDPGGAHPGRMSVVTAAAIIVLSLGLLLQAARQYLRAEMCAVVVLLAACLALLGYTYDVSTVSWTQGMSKMTLPTAVGLLLLSIAALACVPRGALSWAVTGQDAGAALVRRLVPLAIVGIPLLGLIGVVAERNGWLDSSAAAAVIVVVCAAAVGGFAWAAARRLARVDRRRAQAIAELTGLRIDLENQVQQRAEQLQRRHDEIAVLEDRQRIAADLHDIVIQRLFAAGMYLQSGADGADEETRRRLDSAVEAMDVAIKDLRASIFELGGRVIARISVTTAVEEVCEESGRVLGFEPDVLIDDPHEQCEAYRDDVLAVLREALANVARHADASSVGVVLRVGDGFVWLSVTDDGRGMGKIDRRSGTRNMAQRAKEYGGDCTWTRLTPHGTRVLWRVPVVFAGVPVPIRG